MRQLILRNFQAPGDCVMLTAAVRDLHAYHPGQFLTDVRSSSPGLWEGNPYLTPLREGAPGVELFSCEYPLVHKSNEAPYHFIWGFIEHLNSRLGTRIQPTAFKGDVYVSALEKSWMSQVEEVVEREVPFWIVVAGGKDETPIKWWNTERYQAVVDAFQGRILFVQVGRADHRHPPLRGVLDLRGKTDLRQLVRLVYHSQGVLCGVTLMMHLAAAVEVRPGMPLNRPCVVIAGGREPPHWLAYPHHQVLHRVGALLCCDNGGCWKARLVPLDDEDDEVCVDVVGSGKGALPRCMHLVTPADVIRAIELYFEGGAVRYLTPDETTAAAAAVQRNSPSAPPQNAQAVLVRRVSEAATTASA